jgi:hypothetical protein
VSPLSPFHGENTGSIPVGRANNFNQLVQNPPCPVQYLSNRWAWICVDAGDDHGD